MIVISLEELAQLVSGQRPRLEVGYLPHEVSQFFGTSKSTIHLSADSARHILAEHRDHIELKDFSVLPKVLQQGGWINDRENHCAVIYFSTEHDWHFHAVVKVTKNRGETLVVSFRKSRRKAVKRTVKKGTKLRGHW